MDALDVRVPAASVLDEEALAVPVRDIGNAVTGNAWVVLHHCLTAAQETVYEGGLAHVWATNNSHGAEVFLGVGILHAEGTGKFFPFLLAHWLFAIRLIVFTEVGVAELGIIKLTVLELRLVEFVVEFFGVEIARGPAAVRVTGYFFFELAHWVVELGIEVACGVIIFLTCKILRHVQTPSQFR